MSDVKDKVIKIVASRMGADETTIEDNTSFINDLGADSLDVVEIVMELEQEFDIKIPEEAADEIRTVGEAVTYIEKEIEKNK